MSSVRGPLAQLAEQEPFKLLVAGSIPARLTYQEDISEVRPVTRIVTMVTWIAAPEWLTIGEASYLTGHDPETVRWLIDDGAFEVRREGGAWLIDKVSLREYQETLLEVLQGCWG